MVDRIIILMKAKNISARQFAEEIGVQPSGMSHILSGRNNPSLDFVMKVMKRWPEVNINWLMFGKGEMYAAPPLNVSANAAAESEMISGQKQQSDTFDLFSQPELDVVNSVEKPSNDIVQNERERMPVKEGKSVVQLAEERDVHVPFERKEGLMADSISNKYSVPPAQPHENCIDETVLMTDGDKAILANKRIERSVVFYSDHTFSDYLPD